jgi:hypothetical protein
MGSERIVGDPEGIYLVLQRPPPLTRQLLPFRVEASRDRLWIESAVKPHSEYWVPVAPPEAQRRHEEWRQALALAPTIRRMWRIAIEDFAPAQLDRHLRAFRGFHEDPDAIEYRMRPWQKTRPNEAGPRDVVGIAPWELALMFQIAMENEEPIPAYTRQSGEGFRFLLPALGRFMGTTREQARYLAEQGLPWCVGPWCAEEHRHSNTLARLIERVMGRPPRRDNPNQPIVVTSEEKAAFEHLMSRQTTEWNASSSYLVMAAHSQGELHKIVRNLERDEVKHLAILGAVHCYLFGWQPWRRLWVVIRQGLANYGLQRQRRSGGRMLGANPVTAVEGIVAHLLTEFFVRRWLRTVPLRTLRAVFEAPSRLQELASTETEPGEAERIQETDRREAERRVALGRWSARQREAAERLARFERESSGLIESRIAIELDSFSGAEIAGSDGDLALRRRLLRGAGPRALRSVVLERLRDYQIRGRLTCSASEDVVETLDC